MALRSVGNGAEQIQTGARGGRPDVFNDDKGHIRYTTQENHFDGWSPFHQLWKLIKYVPDQVTLNDLIVNDSSVRYNEGVYVCQDFKILNAITMNFDTQGIVVVALGDVEITGTINASSKGPIGGSDASSEKVDPASGLGQGAGGGTTASNSYSSVCSLTGSGGARGAGVRCRAGRGGSGGGGIVIKSYGNITVNNTGRLFANGANGGSGSATSGNSSNYGIGGGGGGSGGVIILDAAGDIHVKPSATISAQGGTGGSGRNAGSGGSAGGGGGGGGGEIIIQAGGRRKVENFIYVNGGNPGTGSGSSNKGGAGGSCAGKGGTSSQRGQNGQVRKFGSPFTL